MNREDWARRTLWFLPWRLGAWTYFALASWYAWHAEALLAWLFLMAWLVQWNGYRFARVQFLRGWQFGFLDAVNMHADVMHGRAPALMLRGMHSGDAIPEPWDDMPEQSEDWSES